MVRSTWPLLLTLAITAGAGVLLLDRLDAAFGTALAAAVLWVAAVDLDRFEIPDGGVCAIFALGLGWIYFAMEVDLAGIAEACFRALAAAGLLYVVRAAYRTFRGTEGLGLGDVKLAAAGAPWLSWFTMSMVLLIAVGAAIVIIIGKSLVSKQRIDMQAALPLGAFLAPAIWIAWFASTANL